MERSFQRRLIVGQASILLALATAVAVAILALRSTEEHTAQAARIQARLALLDRLRTDTRELARAARRYLLTRDPQDRSQTLSIEARLHEARARLGQDTPGEPAGRLQQELERYTPAVVQATAEDPGELASRLARFEDDLARARDSLGKVFDELVLHDRARLPAAESAARLIRGARWALLIAGGLAAVLVIGLTAGVLRRLARDREQMWCAEDKARRAVDAHQEILDAARALRGPIAAILDRCARLRSMKPRDEARPQELEAIEISARHVAGLLGALVDATATEPAHSAPRPEPNLLK